MKIRNLDLTKSASIANIVAVPIAVFAAVFSMLAYKATWDVAEFSGALQKPIVTLGIGGHRLNPLSEASVIVGSADFHKENTAVIASIPFSLANEGDKTVNLPVITIRTPSFTGRKHLEAMTFSATGAVDASDLKRSLTSDNQFDYSSYQLKSLNPKMGARLDEPFYAHETRIDTDVHATSKDGVPISGKITMMYSVQWLVTVSGVDIATVDYPVSVAGVYATTLEELSKFANEHRVAKERKDFREQLGFVKYLAGLIFRNEMRSIYFVLQDSQIMDVEGGQGKISSPKGEAKVVSGEYDLLSWSYLF